MNEHSWLTSSDPVAMFTFARRKISKRKRRLFACAWLRQQCAWFVNPYSAYDPATWGLADYAGGLAACREALAVGERLADGRASRGERLEAHQNALSWAGWMAPYDVGLSYANYLAAAATQGGGDIVPYICTLNPYSDDAAGHAALVKSQGRQADLLRELVGNPFRPVALAAHWLRYADGAILKIAHEIRETHDFGQLPLLADALEDAGCTEPVLLAHCREPSGHVFGCWVLDLLTGRR